MPGPLERPEEEEGEEADDSGDETDVGLGATCAIEPAGFAERKADNFWKSEKGYNALSAAIIEMKTEAALNSSSTMVEQRLTALLVRLLQQRINSPVVHFKRIKWCAFNVGDGFLPSIGWQGSPRREGRIVVAE